MKPEGRKRGALVITGAGGYIGTLLIDALVKESSWRGRIVAMDVRDTDSRERKPGVQYLKADVRSTELPRIFKECGAETVVHLASIVTPGRDEDREFLFSVDVLGTENVLHACLETGVKNLVVTSSGAAYGYHPDNPDPLYEKDALRGNPEFAYSDHKRQVEEMLALHRERHPELKQLIFRPGTILGATADNQITALFRKPLIMGLRGAASPFVFIWDRDLVRCMVKGIREELSGVYNMAGDGVLTMKEIARLLGKPYIEIPAWLVKAALWALSRMNMTRYGPEQVDFLRYRPVLSNRRLKEVFGCVPEMSTRDVFDFYLKEGQIGRKRRS